MADKSAATASLLILKNQFESSVEENSGRTSEVLVWVWLELTRISSSFSDSASFVSDFHHTTQ